MQILININDYCYEMTKKFGRLSYINDDELTDAIINGIVLPKNHGRLIDENQLIKDLYLSKNTTGTHDAKTVHIVEDFCKLYAETIIPAEVEENGKSL